MSTIYEELGIDVGEDYVPYVSLDPLNDPKSFTYRIKVIPRVTPLPHHSVHNIKFDLCDLIIPGTRPRHPQHDPPRAHRRHEEGDLRDELILVPRGPVRKHPRGHPF